MKVYVDIDETICYYEGERHYPNALPNSERINDINELYDAGHDITYWTARGYVTGIDWYAVTESQLREWGCKYHELRMGKPLYDLFIDDKNINSKDIDKLESYLND